MADYIYLLENRLSRAQREALHQVRDTARSHGMTIFLVGGAVRDLTSGAPIRDLNFAAQGDARQLAEDLGRQGRLLGSNDPMQSLYFSFPGGVRLEVASTSSVSYPKPGKPSVQPASLLEDLRCRDFTANAMAISLNEGSYGLLMDPTNGVADVENRELRLLSNYGFLEDPSRMVRATRLGARLGWQMEERTQTRYNNAKSEGAISVLGDWERRYEAEAIFREEDPLRVMRKLEAEGWLQQLSPALNPAKVDEGELDRLRELVGQLNSLSLFPDTSAVVFPMVTAKLGAANVAQLKQAFALPGFASQIDGLEEKAKGLASELVSRANATPSTSWKLLMTSEPESVLWMAFSSRSTAVQTKLKLFFNEWTHARQKVPYQQMQEMRITAELPGYDALLESLFFASMDGKLDSPEAIKAFLEPFSPPAAPPPPTLRRRAVKRESKTAKSRSKKAVAAENVAGPDDASTAAEVTAESSVPESPQPAREAKPATPVAASGANAEEPAREAGPVPARGAKEAQAKSSAGAVAAGSVAGNSGTAVKQSATAPPAPSATPGAKASPKPGATPSPKPSATPSPKPGHAATPAQPDASSAKKSAAPAKAAKAAPAKAVAQKSAAALSEKAVSAKAKASERPAARTDAKVAPGKSEAKRSGTPAAKAVKPGAPAKSPQNAQKKAAPASPQKVGAKGTGKNDAAPQSGTARTPVKAAAKSTPAKRR